LRAAVSIQGFVVSIGFHGRESNFGEKLCPFMSNLKSMFCITDSHIFFKNECFFAKRYFAKYDEGIYHDDAEENTVLKEIPTNSFTAS